MKTAEEFKHCKKPQMVVSIIELMVFQGWDISSFVYGFKSYTKDQLITKYQFHLVYQNKQN